MFVAWTSQTKCHLPKEPSPGAKSLELVPGLSCPSNNHEVMDLILTQNTGFKHHKNETWSLNKCKNVTFGTGLKTLVRQQRIPYGRKLWNVNQREIKWSLNKCKNVIFGTGLKTLERQQRIPYGKKTWNVNQGELPCYWFQCKVGYLFWFRPNTLVCDN